MTDRTKTIYANDGTKLLIELTEVAPRVFHASVMVDDVRAHCWEIDRGQAPAMWVRAMQVANSMQTLRNAIQDANDYVGGA